MGACERLGLPHGVGAADPDRPSSRRRSAEGESPDRTLSVRSIFEIFQFSAISEGIDRMDNRELVDRYMKAFESYDEETIREGRIE
jgi:hypothetical protein